MQFEPLESRRHLSSTLQASTLTIRGTNTSDVVSVTLNADTGGRKILKVTMNGSRQNYDTTSVTGIRIELLDGNDQLYIDKTIVRGFAITGGNGDDTIQGGGGADTIQGGAGNDFITGNGGNDRLYGDAGGDYLQGNDGKDYLFGGDGNDTLFGGAGADTLTGDDGNDQLYGQSGDDVFHSRDNTSDTLVGGSGYHQAQRDSMDVGNGISAVLA